MLLCVTHKIGSRSGIQRVCRNGLKNTCIVESRGRGFDRLGRSVCAGCGCVDVAWLVGWFKMCVSGRDARVVTSYRTVNGTIMNTVVSIESIYVCRAGKPARKIKEDSV